MDENQYRKNIKPILRKISKQLDEYPMSRAELARRIHVSRSTVSKWLLCERTMSMRYLLAIIRELGLDASEIFANDKNQVAQAKAK